MKRLRLPLLCALLLAAVLASLRVGRYPLSTGDLCAILAGRCGDAMKRAVFWNVRLPRTLLTCLSGAALSLAGWAYQCIFMNALVSPDVLGVSSGCAIGAIAAILAGLPSMMIQGASLLTGIATVAVTLLLARAIGRHHNLAMLLSGVVTGALANSAIMLMKYVADPAGELAAIEYWLMGSFHTASWAKLRAALPLLIAACAAVLLLRHPVRLLSLGDEEAGSLGVPVAAVKYGALMAATALVASVVSVAGSVSWLGLIVPHICRLFGGEANSTPFETMVVGAALLSLVDLAARTLTSSEVPISILTSLMGAAFLLLLLALRRGRVRRGAL